MTCKDVEAAITAYLDGELDPVRSSALRGHARGCDACRALVEDHARLAGALAELAPVEPPAAMWDGVMARLAEAEAVDARRSRTSLWSARLWARVRPHLVPAVALAAAAALAVVVIDRRRGDDVVPDRATALASPPGAPEPGRPSAGSGEGTAPSPSLSPAGPGAAAPTGRGQPGVAPGDRVDIDVALAREASRIDGIYVATVDELLAAAAEDRPSWPAAQQRAYDAEVARRRAAAEAATGADRDRAWQGLVSYLQRAALGELVAEVRR